MRAVLSRRFIVFKNAWSTAAVNFVIREVCTVLMEKGYRPVVMFTGSPVVREGGMEVKVEVDRDMSDMDYELVARLLENIGIHVDLDSN